jgi:hypothetical protein
MNRKTYSAFWMSQKTRIQRTHAPAARPEDAAFIRENSRTFLLILECNE